MRIEQLHKFLGGQNPKYCGRKRLPAGRVMGTANECYLIGRRSGFYAGFLKGRQFVEEPIIQFVEEPLAPLSPVAIQVLPSPVARPVLPSINQLYSTRPRTTRIRDMMAVLPISHPEYKKLTTRQKKAMGTDGLRNWLTNTVREYRD